MKIKVEAYYEWVTEDGDDVTSTAKDLDDMFEGEEWPETILVYHVDAGAIYIGRFTEKEIADMVAALLESEGGQAQLELIAATKKLLEHN